MPCLKTSEGFPHYIRCTRARDVDNRKGLQRSSDGSPWRRSGLRCCAVAGERRGAAKERISSPLWPFLTHPTQDRRDTTDNIDIGRRAAATV